MEALERKANGLPTDDNNITTTFYWPKDKVLYQRLELVCYCIGKSSYYYICNP